MSVGSSTPLAWRSARSWVAAESPEAPSRLPVVPTRVSGDIPTVTERR